MPAHVHAHYWVVPITHDACTNMSERRLVCWVCSKFCACLFFAVGGFFTLHLLNHMGFICIEFKLLIAWCDLLFLCIELILITVIMQSVKLPTLNSVHITSCRLAISTGQSQVECQLLSREKWMQQRPRGRQPNDTIWTQDEDAAVADVCYR